MQSSRNAWLMVCVVLLAYNTLVASADEPNSKVDKNATDPRVSKHLSYRIMAKRVEYARQELDETIEAGRNLRDVSRALRQQRSALQIATIRLELLKDELDHRYRTADACFRYASELVEDAKNNFELAQVANKKVPGTVPDLIVNRLKLRMEMAQLRLEEAKLPIDGRLITLSK